MVIFTSLDLQKITGDVQRAAAQAPVVITSHGKPRNVMMSVEEFRRLKLAVGETVPLEVQPVSVTVIRKADDPLGYDVSDLAAVAAKMAADEASGAGEAAVQAELGVVRSRFRGKAS